MNTFKLAIQVNRILRPVLDDFNFFFFPHDER